MSELQLMTMCYAIDDFCKAFEPISQRSLLQSGQRVRARQTTLALSDIMTILVYFHCSHYRTFKHYYTEQSRRTYVPISRSS
jgi:hypothetical protein